MERTALQLALLNVRRAPQVPTAPEMAQSPLLLAQQAHTVRPEPLLPFRAHQETTATNRMAPPRPVCLGRTAQRPA